MIRNAWVITAFVTGTTAFAQEQAASGVTDDYIRLAIGIEDLNDILWDLDQALTVAQAVVEHAARGR